MRRCCCCCGDHHWSQNQQSPDIHIDCSLSSELTCLDQRWLVADHHFSGLERQELGGSRRCICEDIFSGLIDYQVPRSLVMGDLGIHRHMILREQKTYLRTCSSLQSGRSLVGKIFQGGGPILQEERRCLDNASLCCLEGCFRIVLQRVFRRVRRVRWKKGSLVNRAKDQIGRV